MARHLRRLTLWFPGGIAVLVLLALLALAALWHWFDPDDYRAQIESRASSAIGRPVHLTGKLHWQPGWRISIVSEGGEIANASGFGSQPLARWSRIRLGLAARPLLDKRVLIDHIEVEGLQLQLQRDASGTVNWELQMPGTNEEAAQSVAIRIADVAVHGGTVRYQDASTRADWRVTSLEASAKLPEELAAAQRVFRDVKVEGRAAGGLLTDAGVPFALQTSALRTSPQRLQMPRYTAHWADANLGGEVDVNMVGPEVAAKLELKAPSLRALLATAGIAPPPMRDSSTFGALQMALSLNYSAGAVKLDDMSAMLDGTNLTGTLSLPKLQPLALRFNLAADRIDLDRYREPADVQGKPLELPLAWLKQLDAKGTLRISKATVAGAAAKELRIDVE